jgi:N-acetylglucosamine-6-phosphate deacetylase
MKKAIKNIVQFGFPLTDAVKFASVNPARIMKYNHKGIISPTYDSDLIVMDKLFSIKLVMAEGRILKNKLEEAK